MRLKQQARELWPYLQEYVQRSTARADGNNGGGGGGGSIGTSVPSHVNYILAIEGSACVAFHGKTGMVAFFSTNHASAIQSAINAAGIWGVLAFRPGTYWIGTQLTPLARQSWYCVYGAVFRPTGNNRILYAQQIDWWQVYGTLHIEDTDNHTTSVEAIYLNGIAACYFQHIVIWDYYKGITFTGEAQRAFENVFENLYLAVIRYQGLAIWAEVGDNYFHNVFIKGPSTTEWAAAQGLVIGLYPSVGTIFGGIMFGRVEVLDCFVNIDLQGLYEVWFDQILSDNAYWAALYIGDRVQRLFVDRVWVAGSGDGLWIQGSAESFAQRLQFNQIFAWVNAQYGVHLNGWVRDVHIGSLYLLENQIAQLRFARGQNKNIAIDRLTVADSNRIAVDAGGIDAVSDNVSIAHAEIDAGECMGLDLLRHIDGTRAGKLFENRGCVVYVPTGTAAVSVLHGLENRPLYIQLTPFHADARQPYISALDQTNFTINVFANVGAPARISWQARTGVEVSLELLANPNVDGNPPANWTASNGASIETVDVYNGATSLRINTNFATWRSDAFAAFPFARYRIWGYVKGAGNVFAELTIRFWSGAGGSGTLLQEAAIPLPSIYDYSTQYVRVQADFSAPAGTQSADLVFRNTAGSTTDVYGDDFEFKEVGGSNLLANASVESGSAPDDWTLTGVTLESGTARTGSRSLHVTNSGSRKEAKADWVAITGGNSYAASAWLQGQASGNVALVVQWFSDAGGIGNLIREDIEYITGTFGSWAQVSATFTAPVTAQSAYFIWRMEGWVAYDLRGDGFSARQLI